MHINKHSHRRFFSREEETALALRAKAGDGNAAWQLVNGFSLLIKGVVHCYVRTSGLTPDHRDDLFAELQLVAVGVIPKFEPEKGRFAPFVIWYLKNRATEYVETEKLGVRVESGITRKLWKLRRYLAVNSYCEAVEKAGLSQSQGANLAFLLRAKTSLDQPSSNDEDAETTFLQRLFDPEQRTPEEQCIERNEQTTRQMALRSAVAALNPRLRGIIIERFGLDGGGKKTLDFIGQRIGLSKERVRQLEVEALKELRRALKTEESQVL